ncbi:Ecp33 [Fulvia fulva]|uniref:Ecp33 n=1 Tax=Passalora fulva TaxID=5499 RepID=A0A1P8YXR7_PASFU|nr:Ecp33 [Fulvia fulva]AQA29237.1 extracellular protein 33 [Fulvia fulva]KAK4626839.1 Ecp33 [Fulvia fulva]KAK4628519.1 Ecp33 [Fulvia fulva]UJO16986.1 Ecp33 [Fulvia fulva]WPV13704.1 Ecp33 [Fulvia fulva]
MRATTAAAILAFCANWAIAAPIREATLDELTTELCKSLVFPDVSPPTQAEQKCNELLGEVKGDIRELPKLPVVNRCAEGLPKDLSIDLPDIPDLREIASRSPETEEDLSHLTAEKCKNMAFLAVMPPTAAELKCRELLKESPNVLACEDEDDLSHLTKEICENSAFQMNFPPTPAELKCREILGLDPEIGLPQSATSPLRQAHNRRGADG